MPAKPPLAAENLEPAASQDPPLPARAEILRQLASSELRRLWALAPNIVFLNHGSFGACPRTVLELQSELRQQLEAEPVQFLWRRYEERLEPCRQAVAAFLGARARDLVFVTNATTGVNAVIRSAGLQAGDEVLSTNLDYNACHNALLQAAQERGARVVTARVPFPLSSEQEILEAIMRAVTPRTRLAMIDHVTSNTGIVLPVARIIRELHAIGVEVLVDGAHAPGMLPLNLDELRPAYYTGNLHKWVCAPKGTAFLWVREDKQERMQPAVISHGNNTPRPGYTGFQDRFDWAGTLDVTGWLCAGAAIEFCATLFPGGWPELRERNHRLATAARASLCRQLQVGPPCPESMLGSMATVPLPERLQARPRAGKIDVEQLELYDRFGIEVPLARVGEPARRYFRISAHAYNFQAEYDYLACALQNCA